MLNHFLDHKRFEKAEAILERTAPEMAEAI